MARSKITNITEDLVDDSGSVLFSLVRGEQLEFPLVLEFAQVDTSLYDLEAVVIEGAHIPGSTPISVEPSGDETTLTIRVPTDTGTWNPITAYNTEEVVDYNTIHYKLRAGVARVDATTPDVDPVWEVFDERTIYLQFPKVLTITPAYVATPDVDTPVYGFFELRVTEPVNAIFIQTWKPTRGLVEILFSPTHLVV
ncbi:MAG: hypothetical protein DRR06_09210 [Gammaproteobacteria bacterium]|nr:MAG: hypothetical protein DRR06_09210 [Gammaproteobacteria bacterium]